MTWLVILAIGLNVFSLCLSAYNWRVRRTLPERLRRDREQWLRSHQTRPGSSTMTFTTLRTKDD